MKSVYLAWRDPAKRWYPVGELSFDGRVYRFRYLAGSADAEREAGFRPLVSFPAFDEEYASEDLFPTFENRIPSPAHADYLAYMDWLALPVGERDDLAVLARSGAARATDLFEVFPRPERTADGRYVVHVFAHGLRHLPEAAKARAMELESGESLDLVPEPENPVDPLALRKHTGDGVHVGYVPRYLVQDLHALRGTVTVTVERVNLPPAPIQFRLLCRIEAPWPDGFSPCSGELFAPRAATPAAHT